jgi:hypothetical protein
VGKEGGSGSTKQAPKGFRVHPESLPRLIVGLTLHTRVHSRSNAPLGKSAIGTLFSCVSLT